MDKKIVFEKRRAKDTLTNITKIKYMDFPHLGRDFIRYDFTDEWNNLGYGKITTDNSRWSLSILNTVDIQLDKVLGQVTDDDKNYICDLIYFFIMKISKP